MKKLLPLVLAGALLSACAAPSQPVQGEAEATASPAPSAQSFPLYPEEIQPRTMELDMEFEDIFLADTVYSAPAGMTEQETIAAYFDELYWGYTSMTYNDISDLLDMEQQNNRNLLVWSQMLATRRQLIYDNSFCYVETQQFPYTIRYISEGELKDHRMDFWNDGLLGDADEVSFHFVIQGQEGKAYPPVLAVNTQHTMRLKKIDGQWKITYHYFPGSYRKFANTSRMEAASRETMLSALKREFSQTAPPASLPIPSGAKAYDGANAARYAKTYTESRSPQFYDVGDWMGNCANFTSQCIWYGFSGDGQSTKSNSGLPYMTKTWYGGTGGGTPSWENVGYFWDYATTSSDLKCQTFANASQLRYGDLIQTKNSNSGSYNHSLVVVDQNTLLLGQNSPGCFVYYSDLVDVQFRYLRPAYIQ